MATVHIRAFADSLSKQLIIDDEEFCEAEPFRSLSDTIFAIGEEPENFGIDYNLASKIVKIEITIERN